MGLNETKVTIDKRLASWPQNLSDFDVNDLGLLSHAPAGLAAVTVVGQNLYDSLEDSRIQMGAF